jgi:galactokinase
VVGEIERVEKACEDLVAGRIEDFGKKMYETHDGLSKDYEVSCEELDFLVDFTKNDPDILGSRMMGGGFGGCTINIIKETAIPSFKKNVSEAYKTRFGHPPLFYDVKVDDGVRRVID